MNSQKQHASGDAQAYQASGDIIIHNGLGSEGMTQIISALSQQIAGFLADAKVTQEARFRELRDEIVKEFCKPEATANSSAFKDPDFQYSVKNALDGFARSGTESAKGELVKLIAERSKKPTGSRVANVINTAIRTAPDISASDYTLLVVVFFLQNTIFTVPLRKSIVDNFRTNLEPFITSMERGRFASEYLASLGCLSINQLTSNPFVSILDNAYGHAFGPGFSEEELLSACDGAPPPQDLRHLLFKVRNGETALYFAHGIDANLREQLELAHVPEPHVIKMVQLMQSKKAAAGFVYEEFKREWPEIENLRRFWDEQGLGAINLTLLGKALAHSALAGKSPFNAPLEIWVQ